MMLAIVNEWVVTNIVTIDESDFQKYSNNCQIAIHIDGIYPQPQIGWTFDGRLLNPPAGFTPSMKITRLAFRERFTFPELVAIQTAQASNPALQVLEGNLSASTFIDLTRADTIQGVGLLASLGLITPTRANTILTTIPTAIELYQG